ncbi:hypothetical protein F4778DRAFT_779670 [Xylariomycetidae sp. FL2044]|nr:hypothetical protein F4778DRAFT_779670 [Xylariomycetidae sp. FL2044]
MGDLKTRIKNKFLRRNSIITPSLASTGSIKNSLGRNYDGASSTHSHASRARSLLTGYAASDEHSDRHDSRNQTSSHDSVRSKPTTADRSPDGDGPAAPAPAPAPPGSSINGRTSESALSGAGAGLAGLFAKTSPLANSNTHDNSSPAPDPSSILGSDLQNLANLTTSPSITTPGAALPSIHEHPAASSPPKPPPTLAIDSPGTPSPNKDETVSSIDDRSPAILTPSILTPSSLAVPLSPSKARPLGPPRRQSILPNRQTTLIKALLNAEHAAEADLNEPDHITPISGNMVTRKIWVKRPLASATLVTINEDDLVDDVREMILRKYANSLGRQFDAPDLTLRICNREQQTSRPLQPDEPMGRTLDAYYPGGQTVDDALLIDIPSRRTPKASPNPRYLGDDRPHESATDYFPPYPPPAHAHHLGNTSSTSLNAAHTVHLPPSIAVIGGAQLPALPSPGGTRRLPTSRPKMQRIHTASPVSTIANGHGSQTGAPPSGTHIYSRPPRSRTHSVASSDQSSHSHAPAPTAPAAPVPTPPVPERVATPPPRVASPRPTARPKKNKKIIDHPSLPPGLLNGGVPPINVLIVEDNIINLRLLEAFVKRLKVRWQTAMNGREAVNKWRAGGFHLVLMDIQLPVMNGLEATREIRRIEKVNSIGVFSSSASSPPEEIQAEPAEEDKLANTEMFKSPVIIVALTASSLQSDRHEALAAGCNDFLTKPVNFVWLERKVMEWGCMQALIDFDGWRKWKDFSQKSGEDDAAKKAAAAKAKTPKKNRLSLNAAQVAA